jgi:hypothetical protein
VLLVHAVRREGTDLDARALGVEQGIDALTGGHLALLVLLGDAFLAAALVDLVKTPVQLAYRELVEILVLRRFQIDLLSHAAKVAGNCVRSVCHRNPTLIS